MMTYSYLLLFLLVSPSFGFLFPQLLKTLPAILSRMSRRSITKEKHPMTVIHAASVINSQRGINRIPLYIKQRLMEQRSQLAKPYRIRVPVYVRKQRFERIPVYMKKPAGFKPHVYLGKQNPVHLKTQRAPVFGKLHIPIEESRFKPSGFPHTKVSLSPQVAVPIVQPIGDSVFPQVSSPAPIHIENPVSEHIASSFPAHLKDSVLEHEENPVSVRVQNAIPVHIQSSVPVHVQSSVPMHVQNFVSENLQNPVAEGTEKPVFGHIQNFVPEQIRNHVTRQTQHSIQGHVQRPIRGNVQHALLANTQQPTPGNVQHPVPGHVPRPKPNHAQYPALANVQIPVLGNIQHPVPGLIRHPILGPAQYPSSANVQHPLPIPIQDAPLYAPAFGNVYPPVVSNNISHYLESDEILLNFRPYDNMVIGNGLNVSGNAPIYGYQYPLIDPLQYAAMLNQDMLNAHVRDIAGSPQELNFHKIKLQQEQLDSLYYNNQKDAFLRLQNMLKQIPQSQDQTQRELLQQEIQKILKELEYYNSNKQNNIPSQLLSSYNHLMANYSSSNGLEKDERYTRTSPQNQIQPIGLQLHQWGNAGLIRYPSQPTLKQPHLDEHKVPTILSSPDLNKEKKPVKQKSPFFNPLNFITYLSDLLKERKRQRERDALKYKNLQAEFLDFLKAQQRYKLKQQLEQEWKQEQQKLQQQVERETKKLQQQLQNEQNLLRQQLRLAQQKLNEQLQQKLEQQQLLETRPDLFVSSPDATDDTDTGDYNFFDPSGDEKITKNAAVVFLKTVDEDKTDKREVDALPKEKVEETLAAVKVLSTLRQISEDEKERSTSDSEEETVNTDQSKTEAASNTAETDKKKQDLADGSQSSPLLQIMNLGEKNFVKTLKDEEEYTDYLVIIPSKTAEQ